MCVWLGVLFSDTLGANLAVQLIALLWTPFAWLVLVYFVLEPPALDQFNSKEDKVVSKSRDARLDVQLASEPLSSDYRTFSVERQVVQHKTHKTGELDSRQRVRFMLGLWPFWLMLVVVQSTKSLMFASVFSSMGFPATSAASRQLWYHCVSLAFTAASFMVQSCTRRLLVSLPILCVIVAGLVLGTLFFGIVAAMSFGGWWLLALAAV